MAKILTLANHLFFFFFFGPMRGLVLLLCFLQHQHLQLPTPEAFHSSVGLFPAELSFFLPRHWPNPCLPFPVFFPQHKPTWLFPLRTEHVDRQTEQRFQRYFSCIAQWQVGKVERDRVSCCLAPATQCPEEAPWTPACHLQHSCSPKYNSWSGERERGAQGGLTAPGSCWLEKALEGAGYGLGLNR